MQNLPLSHEEKIEALHKNIYFSTLSEKGLNSMAQETTLRFYQRGEAICWQGEVCEGLYMIRHGSVKLFKISPKGREFIIKIFREGATLNEAPVFDHDSNPVNVTALEDSQIWIVDAEVIRRGLCEHPEMAQAVILNLSGNLRMLVQTVEGLSFCQVINRLARLISLLPEEQLAGQHITQDQLAARLGTVQEVMARSLRDLERSGAIKVKREQTKVVDEQVLRDWVSNFSSTLGMAAAARTASTSAIRASSAASMACRAQSANLTLASDDVHGQGIDHAQPPNDHTDET